MTRSFFIAEAVHGASGEEQLPLECRTTLARPAPSKDLVHWAADQAAE